LDDHDCRGMTESQCPVCGGELEVREVAPCFDCGADRGELDDLAEGEHTYAELLALGAPVVLCDACQADFSTYDPRYFNRPPATTLGAGELQFVRALRDLAPTRDGFCRRCQRRLAFLRFLVQVRSAPLPP
jgi:hypothetical protein